MPHPLSAETIARVQASVPALEKHGAAITSAMYTKLFEDPVIAALFNRANQGEGGRQVNALAAAILGYARNISDPGVLAPVIERIAQKHIGYHILSAHYPHVANALLAAIEDVLGAAATPDILAAWGQAFWFLADILKDREAAIRSEIERTDGGWSGWRRFVVAGKIRESSVITSFVLRPVDGGAVLPHKPGQYLTLRFDMPGEPGTKRNYSISCAPNSDVYRISVKREVDGMGGSVHLHDRVEIGDTLETTPPAGDFFLPDQPARPVILLSGGVGLTPMVSMAETIAARLPGVETHFVHGALNGDTHAMREHVRALAAGHGRMRTATFYSQPLDADVDHDGTGFVDLAWLRANTPLMDADVYLCGPTPFLRHFVSGLRAEGVAEDRIHYELFGPADDLLAA
ncbi:NO-inducible flavohemoprotein [Sphingomonas oryzagri]|uniref:nitric oxide dioxygenase n=1 Tax=Sphingomonas oryzagri TaxID=3042314 RepID=A0ABT6N5W1_9SPHN|nr:NO-inducible flavohemoprotein [Sphingomonas oryzagri]MDH7640498.1 NO-inducible flavohemoprotein [Sphingomonas oryzagri]